MSVWISARTVHMCQDVLVIEFVGLLGACIKWMSSSMRSMNFFFLSKQNILLFKILLVFPQKQIYTRYSCEIFQ